MSKPAYFAPSELKTILHSKRANIYYNAPIFIIWNIAAYWSMAGGWNM